MKANPLTYTDELDLNVKLSAGKKSSHSTCRLNRPKPSDI